MSSQAAELSFLRCWNCQSLIPAASSQCRMCGAPVGEDRASQPPSHSDILQQTEEQAIPGALNETEVGSLIKAKNNDKQSSPAVAPEAVTEPTIPVDAAPVDAGSAKTEPQPESTPVAPVPRRQVQVKAAAVDAQTGTIPDQLHKDCSAGKLLGWLVSFSDPAGSAIEIREDDFFLTGAKLRRNDLVIQGEHISTPHALITTTTTAAGDLENIAIQDLLSTDGVLLRRGGSDRFEAVDDEAELHHGDSIRVGSEEFLISLLWT